MKHPPYHLRINKAVDRVLLVDILRALGADRKEFSYFSLAGPFLEDLRVMDHFFPLTRLFSLEEELHTYRRQVFHQFSSRLTLLKKSLGDFLSSDYEPGEHDVFWLDYTGLKYPLLEEFQTVLKAVPGGTVVKITLRAQPELELSSLRRRVAETDVLAIQGQMEKSFEDEFQKVLPHPAAGAFSSLKDFARMVQQMVRRAASTALDFAGSDRDFLPVQSARYNDQTQMVSVTGVVCLRTSMKTVRETLKHVRFSGFDWSEPVEINVPALSVKERLHLEEHLPVANGKIAGDELEPALGYRIDRTDSGSKRQLTQYALYHREYPQFVRVAV
ncbi:MAG TPA: O-methyltransferase [Chthoniobacterales bacterium]|jgi:hypothetical protein